MSALVVVLWMRQPVMRTAPTVGDQPSMARTTPPKILQGGGGGWQGGVWQGGAWWGLGFWVVVGGYHMSPRPNSLHHRAQLEGTLGGSGVPLP